MCVFSSLVSAFVHLSRSLSDYIYSLCVVNFSLKSWMRPNKSNLRAGSKFDFSTHPGPIYKCLSNQNDTDRKKKRRERTTTCKTTGKNLLFFFSFSLEHFLGVCVCVKLLWIVKTNYLFRNWTRLEKFWGEKSHSHTAHSSHYTRLHGTDRKMNGVGISCVCGYGFYLPDMDDGSKLIIEISCQTVFANSLSFVHRRWSSFSQNVTETLLLFLLHEKLETLAKAAPNVCKSEKNVCCHQPAHETIRLTFR